MPAIPAAPRTINPEIKSNSITSINLKKGIEFSLNKIHKPRQKTTYF